MTHNIQTVPDQSSTGWICPLCGKVLSPEITSCNNHIKKDKTEKFHKEMQNTKVTK